MKNQQRDDGVIRELIGSRAGRTRVRLVLQARRPQRNSAGGEVKDTSYSQVPGHAQIVEVRTLREFRRLWRAIEQVVQGEEWRDVRRVAAPSELPAAGTPLAVDRP
jgi:hypothetical protein